MRAVTDFVSDPVILGIKAHLPGTLCLLFHVLPRIILHLFQPPALFLFGLLLRSNSTTQLCGGATGKQDVHDTNTYHNCLKYISFPSRKHKPTVKNSSENERICAQTNKRPGRRKEESTMTAALTFYALILAFSSGHLNPKSRRLILHQGWLFFQNTMPSIT